ncbi:MAG: hypothetical protein J7K83_01380 [Candidatus Aenigmarchaeota archaeon]|nr:hypothetical protein [Candidatus Aenigmarchaeota archaeon]
MDLDPRLELEKELAKEEIAQILEKDRLDLLSNLFDDNLKLYSLALAVEELKKDNRLDKKQAKEIQSRILDSLVKENDFLHYTIIAEEAYREFDGNDNTNKTSILTKLKNVTKKYLKPISKIALVSLLIASTVYASGCLANDHGNTTTSSTISNNTTTTSTIEQKDTTPPNIIIDNITKYQNNGSVLVKARIKDFSGVNEAYLIYDSNTITLNKTNSYYQAGFSIANPEDASKIEFTIIANDPFNNTAKKNFEIDWNLRDAYSYFVNKNNFNKSLALQLFDNRPILQNIYASDKNLTKEILFIANNSNKDLQENIAFLALGYADSEQEAKLYFDILYNTQTYQANKELIKALDYYVDAILKQNLPEHDYSILKLFINASNKNPELVDSEPIIVKDNYGHRVIIDSYNKPRDTWMIVEFIKRNPYVASDDNLYLPVNMLIKEMAWNFFDNKFGPRYADKHHNNLSDEELDKIYQPDSKDIWYIIQKLWDYYYNGIGKRYQYVKWWDKQEFAKQYPTELERKLILIGLWDLPNQVADLNHTHTDIRGGWDYDVVWGLKAQKLFVDQLEQMYDILEQARTTSKGKWEYNWGWYAWILDRGYNGLPNMHEQFLGTEFGNIKLPPKINPDYTNWTWYENIFKYDGVDQFLTKNFADYERVKVAYGYVGYHAADYGGEMPSYYYGLTLAFKAYGIPTRINDTLINNGRSSYPAIYIYPVPYGQPNGEFMFPLPKEIRDLLKQKYGNGIVFTPEGGFGMYSLKDGLEKDGVERISSIFYRIWKNSNGIEGKLIVMWEK